ncbi:MAG: hypothetical protein KBS95_01165 [Alistipes sp.]|nr:hypothetical protein [Candidatus Alistipes equi]
MRKNLLIIFLLGPSFLFAQTAREKILADTSYGTSVYRLYTEPQKKETPAPKEYKAFYISHYGRHGSRYIFANKNFDDVLAELQRAHASSMLKEVGEDVYNRFLKAKKTCGGRAGDLTLIGQAQHEGIARRMYQRYPTVFKNNPHIFSCTTITPRCLLCQNCFTNELLRHDSKLEIHFDHGDRYMHALNPYSYNHDPIQAKRIDKYRFPNADWVKDWRKFKKKHMPEDRILHLIFKDEYIPKIKDADMFLLELYRNRICFPGTETDVRLDDLFTPEEMYGWWRLANIKFYYEKGHSNVGGGFLNDVCWTLVDDFIQRADACIDGSTAGKRPCVTLRFGHDGCIIGFLNTLRVGKWAETAKSMEEIENVFHDYDIPMAANLQWVFYKNRKGDDILVKMLLNEEEIDFPVESDCKPYVHWKDLRKYAVDIIEYIKTHPR